MSRSGAIRSVAGDPGSRVTYLSPATIVVSGLPKCWTRWWGAAAQGQVVEAGHILWLALRRVGEYEWQVAFPFGCV